MVYIVLFPRVNIAEKTPVAAPPSKVVKSTFPRTKSLPLSNI